MSVTTSYRAHGLTFDSAIELPYDLAPASASADSPDVTIRFGKVSAVSGDALDVGALCHATPTHCWVDVPTMARYEVRHGSEIVVEPAVDADPAAVAAFLTSSVFGAAVHQRHGVECDGLLLEAALIARDGRAVAIVSSSGNGQSALAASLARAGMTFVGDDLAAVDLPNGEDASDGQWTGPTVHAGSTEVRLWPDTLTHADIDPRQFAQVHSSILKRRVPLRHAPLGVDRLPLVGVIVAGEAADGELVSEELSGRERFVALSHHTWRRRLVTAVGYRNQHFGALATLASKVRVARVVRPRHEPTFDEARDAALSIIDGWFAGDTTSGSTVSGSTDG